MSSRLPYSRSSLSTLSDSRSSRSLERSLSNRTFAESTSASRNLEELTSSRRNLSDRILEDNVLSSPYLTDSVARPAIADRSSYSTTWLEDVGGQVRPLPALSVAVEGFDFDSIQVPITDNPIKELISIPVSKYNDNVLMSLPAAELDMVDILNKMSNLLFDNSYDANPLTVGAIIDATLAPQRSYNDVITIYKVLKTLSEMIRLGIAKLENGRIVV